MRHRLYGAGARGRIAPRRGAGLRGRGAGAPGRTCGLRRAQFLRNTPDLRLVPFRRSSLSPKSPNTPVIPDLIGNPRFSACSEPAPGITCLRHLCLPAPCGASGLNGSDRAISVSFRDRSDGRPVLQATRSAMVARSSSRPVPFSDDVARMTGCAAGRLAIAWATEASIRATADGLSLSALVRTTW